MVFSRQQRVIETVIFDLDDTLIDWSSCEVSWQELTARHMRHVQVCLSEMGFEAPSPKVLQARYMQVVTSSWAEARKTGRAVSLQQVLTDIFSSFEFVVSESELKTLVNSYDWQPVAGVGLFDDTLAVLESVKRQGYKIGLVTNSMTPMWMRDRELEAYGLIDYFDARITSGDTGFIKPHPAIYERIVELLETENGRSVFVGDRPSADIAGANEVGMVSIWMNPPHVDYELDGVTPDYTICKLSELLPILQTLENC